MLQGVQIDGKIVPKEGRCAIATKVEINHALDRMKLSDLVRYLRTREQMFAAMGDGEEFKCSLALIRQVLTIIDPS